MIFFPTELLSLVFDNLTNTQDQLSSQLVCHSWHVPAKRAFYKHIVIQELHDVKNYTNHNYNKTYQFVKFIRSMSSAVGNNNRIPSPGQYVKTLYIDFEIVLETKFMPTPADYQLLATACPNLEEFDFPVTMFWNYLILADIRQYWKKLKKVPAFRLTPTMTTYSLERFLHFKSSLTSLEINYYYGGHSQQQQEFTQLIRLFTKLGKLKITSNTQSFTQMIPLLIECPNITEFNMITTTSAHDIYNTAMVVPKLRHLDLNVRIMSSHLINSLIQIFPDLQKLVLHMSPQHISADLQDAMGHLIRFITTRLSQSVIHLFIPANDSITLTKQFLSSYPSIVNISYDSRSSFTTNIPDLSYHHHSDNQKELSIRYQGSIPPQVQGRDLPHMQLLKAHGFHIHRLKIQSPSSLLTAERDNNNWEESCIQSTLMHDCPNLLELCITHCYFGFSSLPKTQLQQLTHLTLEKSVITTSSLYNLAHQYVNLKYLVLDQCEFDKVDMPVIGFKKLCIMKMVDKEETVEITIFEQRLNRTTTCYYLEGTREIIRQCDQIGISSAIYINCWSMDQFRFNHIPFHLN